MTSPAEASFMPHGATPAGGTSLIPKGALPERTFLFCGGGTGGHVLPGLAVARALRDRGVTALRWIGDPARIEAKLVPNEGIPLMALGLSRPRRLDPRWWCHALATAWGVHRALRRERPAVIIALGGYAALIPGLLARLHRIPLVVMEQNAKPGKTNKLLAKGAQAVITQFPEATESLPVERIRQLGNPVRAIASRPRATGPWLTMLVVGGSLAAKSLNDLVALAGKDLARIPDLRIVHLAGDQDRARVAELYANAGMHRPCPTQTSTAQAEVLGFVHDMPALYERIDLVIGRAGATTVAELCCAGLGAIYVPLPWAADDHQTANAQAMVNAGAAILLPQATTTPADLARLVTELVQDRERVTALGEAARRQARPDAAERVADVVLELAGKSS